MEQELVKRCGCYPGGTHGCEYRFVGYAPGGGDLKGVFGWCLWVRTSHLVCYEEVPEGTSCPWCKRVLLPGGETSAPLQWEAAVGNVEHRANIDLTEVREEAQRLQEEADHEQ